MVGFCSLRVAGAISAARQALPANEARLLLGQVLNRSPAWLLAHDDFVLEDAQLISFDALVARRVMGEPVAYLLG